MSTGTGLDCFEEKYKERFYDIGIAEEHAVTFASGLAANGLLPVFAVYSTFLQRGYDQIIHDAALQNLPVVLAIDRAGFNNSDGATHHGIFDVAFLSQLPDIKLYSPVTYRGLALSLKQALAEEGVSAIRYPSGSEIDKVTEEFYSDAEIETIGIRTDFDVANPPENIIVTHERIAAECIEAKKILESRGVNVGIILCEYISPYSRLADEISAVISGKKIGSVTFVEEEIRSGGFGMLLSDEMMRKGYLCGTKYTIMAADDPFVKREAGQSYLESAGLCAKNIADNICKQ
jgi:1-deoxy-D-xylulose-5-phosphate synthase